MIYHITLYAFFAVLLAVAVIDAGTQEIPPAFPLAVFLLGLLAVFTMRDIRIADRVIGFFAVSLPMYLIVRAVPGGFGGGDIKLMAAAGFFLGWKNILIAFLIALLLGGGYGGLLLITRKAGRKDHFAFGPFLCVGMVTAYYYGTTLVNWYLDLARLLAYGPGK